MAVKSYEDQDRAWANSTPKIVKPVVPTQQVVPSQQVSQVKPADVVQQAINSTNGTSNTGTSTGTGATAYTNGYNSAVTNFKNSYSGGNMDNFKAQESQRLEAEKQAKIAEIRNAIQQGVNAQNKIINDTPAQYVEPMNQANYQGAKNLDYIRESMARRGRFYSGDLDNAEMRINNQTQSNIGALETQKQKIISDAKTAIANLQASGSLEEARAVQEAAAKSLDRIQAQQNLVDNRNNEFNTNLFNSNVSNLKTQYDMGNNDISNKIALDNASLNKLKTMSDLTGQVSANDLISQMSPEQIASYKSLANQNGGYAAAISQATNDKDKAILTAFRNQYLQQNPNNPYANTQSTNTMFDTQQGKQINSALETDKVQRQTAILQQEGIKIANQLSQYEFSTVKPIELGILKTQLQKGELENAYQTVINSNADAKEKAQIASVINDSYVKSQQLINDTNKTNADISQNWAQIGIQQQNANTTSGNLDLNRAEFNAKKQGGMYDKDTTKTSATDEKNNGIAKLSTILDQMDGNTQKSYITKNKENIIRDFGLSTYKSLLEQVGG